MPPQPSPQFLFSPSPPPAGRAGELFAESLQAQQRMTNQLFFGLFVLQWVAGVLLACWRTPLAWEGSQASIHFHVWLAVVFGGVVAGFPLVLISRCPDTAMTRHAIAVAQMLAGALLIDLTGGRIETHFHIFGSLAFLAFYRDPWVLVTATAVVLTDHVGRGILAPLSIYGTTDIGMWRTAEHAFWVIFEDIFLWIACLQSRRQLLGLAQQQSELEQTNEKIESAVAMRTKELTAARDAALESTRLKGQFMANVSHEIRTPMNGILGTTELLLLTELSEEQSEYVTTVQRSAESLLTLINEILDFSKLEAGRLQVRSQSFDLPELLESAFLALAPLAEAKGLRARCGIHGNVPERVIGDALRLRQILNNLIGNAVKFTDRGGIDVRLFVAAEGSAETRVRFEVADTGPGIPAALAPQLFEAFVQGDGTTTRRHEGTGLGLAIVRELCRLMGGEVGFHGRESGGTVFWLELPVEVVTREPVRSELRGLRVRVSDASGEDLGVAEVLRRWGVMPVESASTGVEEVPLVVVAPGAKPVGEVPEAILVAKIQWRKQLGEALLGLLPVADGARRASFRPVDQRSVPVLPRSLFVLVVEDNPINQRLLVRMLNQLGQRADVAADGAVAVEAVRRGEYDLVLMDWQMPRMDGLAATEAIRAMPGRCGRTPIVAITANTMAGDRERCLAAGMDGFLAKPIRLLDLAEVLATACEGSGAAERAVGSAAAGGRFGVGFEAGPRSEGLGENVEQGLEGSEVVAFNSRGEGGLDDMVPGDVDGVDRVHGPGAGGRIGEAAVPPFRPDVVELGVRKERADERMVPESCGGESAESEREVNALTRKRVQEPVGEIEVGSLGLPEQPELGAHAGKPGGIEPFVERFENSDRPGNGGLLIRVNQGQQRLGEAGQVPTGDLGLLAESVAAATVDGAEDGGRVVGIEEGAGPIVDGLAGDGHIVGIHHAVDESDVHPAGNQLGLAVRDGSE